MVPGASVVKNPPADAGDARDEDLIPRSGGSTEEGNGNPLQYSCLENPMDRGAWWPTVHGGHKESDTTEQAHMHTHTSLYITLIEGGALVWDVLESETCSVMSNSLLSHGLYSPQNSPGQNTGMGSLSLLQGIFPSQGLNIGLPHCSSLVWDILTGMDLTPLVNLSAEYLGPFASC